MKQGAATVARKGYIYFRVTLTLVFLLMILVTVVGILGRQIRPYYQLDTLWTSTVSTALLITVIFLGTAVAEIEDEHIEVTVFRDRIVSTVPAFMYLINALVIAFAAVVSYSGVLAARRQWGVPFADLLWLNTGWLYLTIATGFFLVMVNRLYLLLQRDTGGIDNTDTS